MSHASQTPSFTTERAFLLRRLHSLTGIVPLGGFLLFHFFENASVRQGAEAFDETVLKISQMPYLPILEIGTLIIPLLFHALYGLFIRTPSRPNVGSYGYSRNWAYFMQRVTGVIAFAFITYHVISTRLWSVVVKGSHITFADMHDYLSDPLILLFYALGIVAVAFHFANGIWSFSITWGIVTTESAQKRLARLTLLIFVALSVVGLDIAWTFSTKTSFLAALGV
jgi:succinate dehydrogenase/fumarate reductase cytochrome b subunit (b558 family)